MHVLIVEDNTFNALCLMRLFQTVHEDFEITVVNNSLSALNVLAEQKTSLVILDDDLNASDGLYCNGPALADLIWEKYPHLPIIAWCDSEPTHLAFSTVFKHHHKRFDEHSCWLKKVRREQLCESLAYLLLFNKVKKQEALHFLG